MGDIHRLDFQHYFLRQVLGGHYVSPLEPEKIRTILDVGCGTGRWGYEMAQTFPKALVTGLDLEEIQQAGIRKPENYSFTRGNLLKGLPFADGTFECVHQRFVMVYQPLEQWPDDIRELLRVTRPGGFLEIVDGGSVYQPMGPMTQQLTEWWVALFRPLGVNPLKVSELDRYAEQAGLRNAVAQVIDLPIGAWGGRLGQMVQQDLESVFSSVSPRFTAQLGVSPAMLANFLPRLTAEWNQLHTSLRVFMIYGQRLS